MRQRQIIFFVSFRIQRQHSFPDLCLAFIQGMKVRNAVLHYDTYIREELREVFCIINDGIAWTLRTGNVFAQYVLGDKVL